MVNEYIDETYERYISNCHEQSLSSSDKRVLTQIAQKCEVDPSYEFMYPAKAAARLAPYRFAQRNARNYSLAHEVLCGASNENRQRFIQGIQEDHDLGFILSFVNSKYCDQPSVGALFEPLSELFSEVPAASSEDGSEVRKFCQTLLARYPQLVIEGVAHAIGRFASTDTGFLQAEVSMDSSVIDLLESIGYMAEDIDVD